MAGRGPLTLPGGSTGLAFIRTKVSNDLSTTRPDIELVMGAGSLAGDLLGILRSLLGVFWLVCLYCWAIQVEKLIGTTAFQRYGTRLHDVPFPGCENLVFDSDEYWECAISQTSITLDHQVRTRTSGVVSPRLLVHGVKGLRIADASIIPRIPASHTHAPVVMIAEKASDMIKEDWGVRVNDIY
ncbi:Uncharacterized protein OBRU01_15966 [Operophtera brumata]|uniref:Glucose-methanol-choline oxidoreductase C-terminal domain-containing protein n=1 Tax=Operophtera brumata TaxID=104452 RepID=A0A0L7L4A4_OPEBR|nr:Uncharacterized protein OBRU01_15966 [Operophtera brumata]